MQQQQLQQQQEAIGMFNGWVGEGRFLAKAHHGPAAGRTVYLLLCQPVAAAAKRRPAMRANVKRLEKQRARGASRQQEQLEVAAASAAAPAANLPSCELPQPTQAARAAPVTVAATARYHQQCYPLRHYSQRLPLRPSLQQQSRPLPALRRFFPFRMWSIGKRVNKQEEEEEGGDAFGQRPCNT